MEGMEGACMEGELKTAGILLPSADVLWTGNTGCASIYSKYKGWHQPYPKALCLTPSKNTSVQNNNFFSQRQPRSQAHYRISRCSVPSPGSAVVWSAGKVGRRQTGQSTSWRPGMTLRFPLTLRCWAPHCNSHPPTSPFTNLLQRQ